MTDRPEWLTQALMPEVEMAGEGTVTPPAGGPPMSDEWTPEDQARFERHKKEFKSRGLPDTEATRLAKEVIARDKPGGDPKKPLKLSPEVQAKLDKQAKGK